VLQVQNSIFVRVGYVSSVNPSLLRQLIGSFTARWSRLLKVVTAHRSLLEGL